jgi:phage/plasmid-associated DNA primase
LDERVLLNELYERYGKWCVESGRKYTLSRQTLRVRLEDRGYPTKDMTKGRVIFGLRLKETTPF